jgi:hypothetical protein
MLRKSKPKMYDIKLRPIVRNSTKHIIPDNILTKRKEHTEEMVYRCKKNEHLFLGVNGETYICKSKK